MTYPILQGAANRWKYKFVENLLGGINTAKANANLEDNQCIKLNNVLLRAGQVLSDNGYKTFGQVVVGRPQVPYQFKRRDLTTDLILITTSTVYKYSSALLRWILVKGTASTTSTLAYPAGTTVIVVASGVGFATGNLIGITLDNGDQLQTTVTVAGATFTLANAVPVGRSILINAVVLKSVALAGTLDYQVSIDTIAGSDWMVFTNGIDIVKRYDGADCINVPGLPSGGNVVCRSLLLYNTALFLFNTVEGGTAYPQRARRSDQTDPTNWTTGTAGTDNLLDSSDSIVTAAVLGPYMIVYRDKSIVRGSFIGNSGVNYYFETMINTDGAVSTKSVVSVDDYHIFIGQKNIYEYRGDYIISPIGDNIYYHLYGISGELNPAYKNRNFALYSKDLNELWIASVTSTSLDNTCNEVLRYIVSNKAWYHREFKDNLIGSGQYTKQQSLTWDTLVGSWDALTWTWNSQQILGNAAVILLCSAVTNQVYEYDYVSTLDNATAIAYTVETKDFAINTSNFRFDKIEMFIQGMGILLEYSTNQGVSWNTMATINQNVLGRVQVYGQFISDRVRFRWSGTGQNFALQWFGFSYKIENLY